MEANAHIGNFVELKKTRLGAGAKAGHLAYLGDSEIGAGSNIGAGTIFCNYDGTKKHKTNIGEGSFIGSNSTLVAPVHVGSGCIRCGRISHNNDRSRRRTGHWTQPANRERRLGQKAPRKTSRPRATNLKYSEL